MTWSKEELRELKRASIVGLFSLYVGRGRGRPSIEAIAYALNVHRTTVIRVLRRAGFDTSKPPSAYVNWDLQPLGVISDVELGKKLGLSAETVRLKRKERGIEAYKPPKPRWDAEPLGKVPDQQIAQKLGVSLQVVQQARRSRGIPSIFGHGGRRVPGQKMVQLMKVA